MKKLMPIGLMAALCCGGVSVSAIAQQTPAKLDPAELVTPKLDAKVQAIPQVRLEHERPAANEETSSTGSVKSNLALQMEMRAMDRNGDGLVSREEYMSYYEGLFEKMKKDSAGMIDLKDLTASQKSDATTAP